MFRVASILRQPWFSTDVQECTSETICILHLWKQNVVFYIYDYAQNVMPDDWKSWSIVYHRHMDAKEHCLLSWNVAIFIREYFSHKCHHKLHLLYMYFSVLYICPLRGGIVIQTSPWNAIYEKSVSFKARLRAKEKYRGMFEIQKSGDKTSSGVIGLDITTHASPKVGQDQVSGGVSVHCWHAAPVAYVLWRPCTIR